MVAVVSVGTVPRRPNRRVARVPEVVIVVRVVSEAEAEAQPYSGAVWTVVPAIVPERVVIPAVEKVVAVPWITTVPARVPPSPVSAAIPGIVPGIVPQVVVVRCGRVVGGVCHPDTHTVPNISAQAHRKL